MKLIDWASLPTATSRCPSCQPGTGEGCRSLMRIDAPRGMLVVLRKYDVTRASMPGRSTGGTRCAVAKAQPATAVLTTNATTTEWRRAAARVAACGRHCLLRTCFKAGYIGQRNESESTSGAIHL